MLLRLAILVLLGPSIGPVQDAPVPVPVEDEPFHKTVFKNDYVQAFRVHIEPGQSSLMHIHVHDDGAIMLGDATITSQSPGQPEGPPGPVVLGAASARQNEPTPTVHRIHNVGKTPFDVIDVQVLGRPPGPAAGAVTEPAGENPKMRVYRYEIAPGASTPQHAHTRPYLLIAATDADLRMTAPDGRTMDHEIEAGDMHWVDTPVTHAFTNRGRKTAILVEFEIK